MTATCTWDVYSTLHGFGGYDEHGDWGKDGPRLIAHRVAQLAEPHRLVLGATTTSTSSY